MKGQPITQQRWAIVLAGGDGTRLQGLTRKIDGDGRPKQFSRIFGDRSLLSHTLERLQPIFGDRRLMREMRRSDVAAQVNLQGHERARVVMRNTATVEG